jgi:hypothetical protein
MAGAMCVVHPGAGAMNLRPYKANAQFVAMVYGKMQCVCGPSGCGRNEFAPLQG